MQVDLAVAWKEESGFLREEIRHEPSQLRVSLESEQGGTPLWPRGDREWQEIRSGLPEVSDASGGGQAAWGDPLVP